MNRRWKGEGSNTSRPLLVTAQEAKRIAGGRKTQLRRLSRRDKTTGQLKPSGMKPGMTYEVHDAADQPPVARITVTDVVDQKLTDITLEQARAEGHRTRADFADHWMRRHDKTWPLLEEEMCPVCEGTTRLDNGEPCDGGCDEVGTILVEAYLGTERTLEIFKLRHAHRYVWVVTFELAQHLYLHRKTDGGYTADPREALLDAGEVLDPPSPDWAKRSELHRRAALQSTTGARLAGLRTEEERLAELRALAAERNVDIDSDLKVIRHRNNAIERKIRERDEKRAA